MGAGIFLIYGAKTHHGIIAAGSVKVCSLMLSLSYILLGVVELDLGVL